MYSTLNNNKHKDFKYYKDSYEKEHTTSFNPLTKRVVKRSTPQNKVCPSCGVTRSASNKCECNS